MKVILEDALAKIGNIKQDIHASGFWHRVNSINYKYIREEMNEVIHSFVTLARPEATPHVSKRNNQGTNE